jgi:Leucine-rich repeat (LRR) protein
VGLSQLKRLSLSGNRVTNITPLAGLTELEEMMREDG